MLKNRKPIGKSPPLLDYAKSLMTTAAIILSNSAQPNRFGANIKLRAIPQMNLMQPAPANARMV